MRTRTIGGGDRATPVSAIALGAMMFGTATDEETSFAILDRFLASGGTFIDTSNNYAYWVNGTRGGESERLLGRWLSDRGLTDEVVVATKVGGRPARAATALADDIEGLSADVIRRGLDRSLKNLGRDHVDVFYAHVPDPRTPFDEQIRTFGVLAAEGRATHIGLSNHWSWQIERARTLAAAEGLPAVQVLQHHHSYLRSRVDHPSRRSPDGQIGVVSPDLLAYLRDQPGLAPVAYSPLLRGAYARDIDPGELYRHPGNDARRIALQEVAAEAGATPNQVVLAWLMGGDVPFIPLIGASSVGQLDENLAAADLALTSAQRERLDGAN
ncbi:aldo/keto reductase [Microbacterium resistens]|uniref:aldo/keto reductase n=1 Tax=Microbacterium resistens TaxID=156977 RepID=UPI001C59B252|nr:aldo/keto reductase [Microbacterium resistens]MBW1637803.1 aldo/keto reductase [Microbacterium resistens]